MRLLASTILLKKTGLLRILARGLSEFNYESITKDFQWKVPKQFNFAEDVIDAHANNAEKMSLTAFHHLSDKTGQRKWTFQELSEESKALASAILSLGQLNKALIILPRIPEWWLLNIAAMRTNTILLPGTNQLTTHDIDRYTTCSRSDISF
jgi:medium-chain acyl-CoA synthetase